jgi:TonB family protein
MRVERALEKLRELLARRGITSSSAALAAAISGNSVLAAPLGVAAACSSGAVSVAGGAGLVWIALMSTSKLPIALSAAVLLAGGVVVAVQNQAAKRADAELAELSRQNQSIPGLRAQNEKLSLAASQARDLQDEDSRISVLQRQVGELESKAEDRRALAAARQRASRTPNSNEAGPESPSASSYQQPKVLSQTRPVYPVDMLSAGVGGEVMVDLVVDKDGAVQNAFALSSTDKAFESAAVDAVKQWVFQPGQANGHTVFTHLQIPVVFTPSSDPPQPTAGTWF